MGGKSQEGICGLAEQERLRRQAEKREELEDVTLTTNTQKGQQLTKKTKVDASMRKLT
jgi:hypothetical protein